MSKFDRICEECCGGNRSLHASGLVDLTFGNLSVVDRSQGVVAIKPSGVPYQGLTPEDIVVVSLESGEVLRGSLKPSSDTPTHRCLYQKLEDINSIVHTHSRNAVAFAQAGVAIPCLGTTHADYFDGEVRVTRAMSREEIEGDYEWNSGVVIAELFENLDPMRVPSALLRGHGPFSWGSSAEKAVETAYALELVAEMALKTIALNGDVEQLDEHLLRKHFDRKHGEGAYYGQD